ncbi:MAG: signal peptidase I [Lachnospiraceae bacterium]|jgi:signal peptidase I|nr:signal peptidase I [Lachnospiraceae bacterium]
MGRRKGGLSFYRKKKKISSTAIREIAEWFFLVFTAVLIATVLVLSIGMRTSVIGVSMEPGLYNGQEILINHFIYKLVSPKRGDVIVFLPNGNQNTHYYVKRVVGLPGETVQIQNEALYINGVLAEEDGSYDKIADAGIAENEITLGSDEYFVLGDNRNSSEDSRSGNIGPVKRENITGKAWFHMASSGSGMGFIK